MQLTLIQIFHSFSTLQKIKEQNLGFKIDYWCMRNLKILADNYQFFYNARIDLAEKYCLKDDRGEYGHPVDGSGYQYHLREGCTAEDFAKEMNELYSMECDIVPYQISADVLFSSDIKVEGNDIFAIDFCIKEC